MAIYAIGDLQGCFDELQTLLSRLDFSPARDRLWFAGDLVNRGPKSLEVLRFIKELGPSAVTVLGNHDLHLLAVWKEHHRHFGSNETLQPILDAPDRESLLEWLRFRPLMHFDPGLGFALVHAGLPPQWTVPEALRHAGEVEAILQSNQFEEFLHHMYGNEPRRWSEELTGWDRLRFSVNCFTRLRYCREDGTLSFKQKGAPGTQDPGYIPWFAVPERKSADTTILFGHWSTLGFYNDNNVYALDTGCLWGGALTALRLDGGERKVVSVDCAGVTAAHPT